MEIAERIGDAAGLARTYNNIGEIHRAQGDYPLALKWYNKSVEIKEKIGDASGLAATYHNIGYVYFVTNDLKAALDYFTKSRGLYKKIGLEKDAAEEERMIESIKSKIKH